MTTSPHSTVRRNHEELLDFCTEYIGRKLFDLNPVSQDLNHISLRKASVLAVEVVRGVRRNLRIALDIKVEEDRNVIEEALQKSFVPDTPDLSVLILRMFAEDSRGGSWQHKIEFVQEPTQKAGEGSEVLMRGSFNGLRLFHIMDLVRIIIAEFKSVSPTSDLAAFPNDEDFALVVTGIIHRFSHDWDHGANPVASNFPRAHPEILKTLNVSNKFFGRWSKEGPPQLFSLEDFSSWNDGTVRTLHSHPRDGGPLFRFEEHRESSFRWKLIRESVLHYSLKSFSDHILHGVDPLESYATIIESTRYKEPDGFQHEFSILHARLPASIWITELEFWIRLDRAAARDGKSTQDISRSTFPADDTARVALTQKALLGGSRAKEQVTVYPSGSRRFNVRELAKLLEIFYEEAPEYVFITNNCYFLASLIQETAALYSDCSPDEDTWAKRVRTETFDKIMKRYEAARSVSSLVVEDPGCSVSRANSTRSGLTSSLAPGGGDSNTSHSRHASLARATRKVTGIFQRRRSTDQGRVLVHDSDLTDEPEAMDASRDSAVAPNHDAEPNSSRSWLAKTTSEFVRNIFQQRSTTSTTNPRGSSTAELMGAAQPFNENV